MNKYLIRINQEEKKTHIIDMSNHLRTIGLTYADFLSMPNKGDITKEKIINPNAGKLVGEIEMYGKDNLISVKFHEKEIAVLNRKGVYIEDGNEIPFKKYNDFSLDKYTKLKEIGLDCAYSFGEKSQLSHIFCFVKGNGLASTVFGNGNGGSEVALKGLIFALANGIGN